MKIIVDAYGGDNAPLSVLQGAQMAVNEYDVEIILVGKETELKTLAQRENISLKNITFLEAETIIPVEEEPSKIISKYYNSSLAVAIRALAEDTGVATVSAGSTGAIVVGGLRWLKRIKGIKRPALGVLIPNSVSHHLLIDSGANIICRPEMLLQFGIMGSVYMETIMNVKMPRVGMVNIGTEENKGLELQQQASELLKRAPVNFIGNVESSQIPLGGCDVAVADGFTGNIILKLTEGMAKMMKAELKDILMKNNRTKIAALLIKKGLDDMGKKLNASEYGGVPLLGLTKPLIKAHGSSDALAIKNAIRQARNVVEQGTTAKIEEALAELNQQSQE